MRHSINPCHRRDPYPIGTIPECGYRSGSGCECERLLVVRLRVRVKVKVELEVSRED